MSRIERSLNTARAVTFAMLLAATGVGCADLSGPPAQARAAVIVSYALAPDAAPGTAAAFAKADRARVVVSGPGVAVDTIVVATAADTARLRLTVGGVRNGASYDVLIELRRGGDPLFRGSVATPLEAGETTETVVAVRPVAALVVLPDSLPPLSAIGDSLTLKAVVLFATGDVIPDAEVVWSSTDTLVATVSIAGRVEARAPGLAEIHATHEDAMTSRPLRVRVPPEREHAVAVGLNHSCALDENGEAFCWGDNSAGQLGDSSTASRTMPVRVAGGIFFTSISAGSNTTCGLSWDRAVYCWGNVPGNGSQTTPFLVSGTIQFASISVGGSNHACGLSMTGAAHCIGGNTYGQLGTGDTHASTDFRAVFGDPQFRSVSAGLLHTCGVSVDGQALCWGWNDLRQTGTGLTSSRVLLPTPVVGGIPVTSVDAGAAVSCATTDLGAYCWGTNYYGVLGNGASATSVATSPTRVVGGASYERVATANANSLFSPTCGITAAGSAECWGANRSGQLGVSTSLSACPHAGSTFACTGTPAPVAGGLSFTVVEPSGGHSCGLTPDRRLYCWGGNEFGQLGDGTTITAMTPLQVGVDIRFP